MMSPGELEICREALGRAVHDADAITPATVYAAMAGIRTALKERSYTDPELKAAAYVVGHIEELKHLGR